MKKLLTVILVLFSIYANCQDSPKKLKCKFSEDKVDEFTGSTIITTRWRSVMDNAFFSNLSLRFRCIQVKNGDQHLTMSLAISVSGIEALIVEQGSEFMIKFNNDSVVSFNAISREVGETNQVTANYYTTALTANYSISKDQLYYFSKTPIKKVRVYTYSGYREGDVTPGMAQYIMDLAQCLIQRIN